jgi:hypothetical protein
MAHIAALARELMPGIYVTALEVTGSGEGSVFTGSDAQARFAVLLAARALGEVRHLTERVSCRACRVVCVCSGPMKRWS